ncbi:hypothetical protein SALBM311S_01196 [Streptomyces alboniger]
MPADRDNAQGAGATEIVSARRHGFRVTDRNEGIVVDKVTKAADSSQVTAATNPVETGTISRDGTTVIATVNYKVAHDKLTDATRNTLQEAAQQGRDGGLTVEIEGDALHESASDKAVAVSIAIDAPVLLITSGSLAAAGMRSTRPSAWDCLGSGTALQRLQAASPERADADDVSDLQHHLHCGGHAKTGHGDGVSRRHPSRLILPIIDR